MNEQQTQENLVMVIKMVTGEKIVAEFDQENSTSEYIVIKRPLQLHSSKETDENGDIRHFNYFHMWNQLTDDEVFFVPYMHIVTANAVSNDTKKYFDKVSPLLYNGEESENDDLDSFTQSTGESFDMTDDEAQELLLKHFSANTAYMN